MTAPPRPPCALRPKPSAPGKASGAAVAGGVQAGRTAAKAISSRAVLMATPTSVSSYGADTHSPRLPGCCAQYVQTRELGTTLYRPVASGGRWLIIHSSQSLSSVIHPHPDYITKIKKTPF